MKQISKELKEFILKRCGKAHVHRTVNKYFIEMSAEVIRAIAQYEEQNFVREDEKSER